MITLTSSSISGLSIIYAASGTVKLSSSIAIPPSYTIVLNDSNVGTFKIQVVSGAQSTTLLASGTNFTSPTLQVQQTSLTYTTPTVSKAQAELTVIEATPNYIVVSASSVPSSSYTITVANADGQIVTSSFNKLPAPQIVSVSTNGVFGGANRITVVVSNYISGSTVVKLNDQAANVLSESLVASSSNTAVVLSQSVAALGLGLQSIQVSSTSGQTAIYQFVANQLSSTPIFTESFETGWGDVGTSRAPTFLTATFSESFERFWIDTGFSRNPTFLTATYNEGFETGWQPEITSVVYSSGSFKVYGFDLGQIASASINTTSSALTILSDNTASITYSASYNTTYQYSLFTKINTIITGSLKVRSPELSVVENSVLYMDAGFTNAISGNIWYDFSDYNNHGTIVNNPTFNSQYKTLTFNGSNTKITIPNSTALDLNTLSIEAWIKPANRIQSAFIFEKGAVNSQYSLMMESSTIRLRINGKGDLSVSTTNLSTSSYNHVVATYSSGARRMYINGVLVGSDSATGNIPTNNSGIRIGCYNDNGYFFNGEIGTIAVYNKQLSLQEVSDMFNAKKTRYGL